MVRVRAILASVFVTLLAAGPSVAVTSPSAVRAPAVVAPALLPMYCGSLCSPAAPTLVVEAGGGVATVPVPTSVALSGGAVSKAAGGTAGLRILGRAGGWGSFLLGLGDLLGWTVENDDVDLPPPTPTYGTQTVVLVGKSRTGAGPGTYTFNVEVPTKSPTKWTTASWTVTGTGVTGGLSYQFGIRCEGSETWFPPGPVGLSTYGQSDSGSRTCGSGVRITGLRVSVLDMNDQPVYKRVPIGDHDLDWDPTPQRYLQQTVICQDANGDQTPFTQSGPVTDSPSEFEMPAFSCPSGSIAVGVEADLIADGDTYPLGSSEIPQPYLDALGDCVGRAGQGECVLSVEHLDGSATNAKDWKENPQKHRCVYGGAVIAIEYCSPFREPKPDDPPDTVRVPVGDPEPVPQPELRPPPNPKPIPDPEPEPGPGGTWDCPAMDNVGLGDVLTGRVLVLGIVCALQIVFVPDPVETQNATLYVRTRLEETAPYVAVVGGITRLQGLTAALQGMGGGCSGPTMEFHGIQIEPVNLCDPPLKTYAGWLKAALSFFMIAVTVMRLTTSLASAFNIRMPWDKAPDYEQGSLF